MVIHFQNICSTIADEDGRPAISVKVPGIFFWGDWVVCRCINLDIILNNRTNIITKVKGYALSLSKTVLTQYSSSTIVKL